MRRGICILHQNNTLVLTFVSAEFYCVNLKFLAALLGEIWKQSVKGLLLFTELEETLRVI